MPRCKKDGCREEAVPGGKRYCVEHMAQYKANAAAYDARARAAPKCPVCRTAPLFNGREVCSACEAADNALAKHNQTAFFFNQAETVEDLKAWLRDHLSLPY